MKTCTFIAHVANGLKFLLDIIQRWNRKKTHSRNVLIEMCYILLSPSAETRNLRPNTHFRGTNETEFMLIFD